MTTVQVGVSEYDISRSHKDPSQCPVTRAISKKLKIGVGDVDVSAHGVWIWDEWDHASEIYTFENDTVLNFIYSWEAMESVKPFEFSMKKRR